MKNSFIMIYLNIKCRLQNTSYKFWQNKVNICFIQPRKILDFSIRAS